MKKELSKKDTPKNERDLLVRIVTQVQQELQQHQQKENEQQQQKEQYLSTDKQHKEHQQPHFVGKVYACSRSSMQVVSKCVEVILEIVEA